jgi:hypothetical protein
MSRRVYEAVSSSPFADIELTPRRCAASRRRRGARTILVVDDEPNIADLVELYLTARAIGCCRRRPAKRA